MNRRKGIVHRRKNYSSCKFKFLLIFNLFFELVFIDFRFLLIINGLAFEEIFVLAG